MPGGFSKLVNSPLFLTQRASVNAVYPDKVVYSVKDPATGEKVDHEIPTHFVLWSTGISMNPFTQRVSNLLPNQVHRKVRQERSQTWMINLTTSSGN